MGITSKLVHQRACLWISHQVSSNAESSFFQHLVIIPFLGMQDEHFVTNQGDYGFLSMDLNGTVSPKQLKTENILLHNYFSMHFQVELKFGDFFKTKKTLKNVMYKMKYNCLSGILTEFSGINDEWKFLSKVVNGSKMVSEYYWSNSSEMVSFGCNAYKNATRNDDMYNVLVSHSNS